LIKKLFAFAVIILFVYLCITPSLAVDNVKKTSVPVSDGNILYVGGSGPGNYTTIQSAINDANNGDAVFVYDDSSPYLENLQINKSINLTGENNETTVIDGNMEIEYVVRILCNSVNISGFKIINAGDGIQIYSNETTIIKNNIINNIWYGVAVYGGCNNTIYDNIIRDNCGGVLLCSNGQNNIILENTIIDNIGNYINNGIELYYSSYNKIIGNLIKGSPWNILLEHSCKNIIDNNLIENARQRGISISFMAHNNIISNNTIINSKYIGLQIEANGNKIIHNNFINNPDQCAFTVYNPFFYPKFNYNKWDGNYWDNWIGLTKPLFIKFPKIIVGQFTRSRIYIPAFSFDWHPAKEPYNI